MTDPRDAARARFDAIAREVAERAALDALDEEPALFHPPYQVRRRIVGAVQRAVVDAILDASGVEVVEQQVRSMGGAGWLFLVDDDDPTHTQAVIRLPAQPIEGGT